jgi:DNA-binding IclR family transcriptional regulator
LSLTEIASALGMSKSGVHRLVATLTRRRFVVRSSGGGYRLGIKTWEIGCTAPGVELATLAAPHMAQLAATISEGVILGRLDGCDVVYLHLVEGPQTVRVHANVGDRIPAHCTSTGLALLAALAPHELRAILPQRLKSVTPATISSRDQLLHELDAVRRRGHVVNRGGWRLDVGGAAVCVTHADGRAIAALCVAVPLYRMTRTWLTRVLPHLRSAADRIGVSVTVPPGMRLQGRRRA